MSGIDLLKFHDPWEPCDKEIYQYHADIMV